MIVILEDILVKGWW